MLQGVEIGVQAGTLYKAAPGRAGWIIRPVQPVARLPTCVINLKFSFNFRTCLGGKYGWLVDKAGTSDWHGGAL